MGKLKVAMGTEKGFIDAGLLVSCMEQSFRRISEAAVGKRADHDSKLDFVGQSIWQPCGNY